MTFVFPGSTIGGNPTVARTANLLLSDGTNTGSVTVASILAFVTPSDAPLLAPRANPPFTGTATFVNATLSGLLITAGEIKATRIITTSGNVTATSSDRIILLNKTSGAATQVTLPSSPTAGTVITIKDMKGDAATNNITVVPASGTIDGVSSVVMSTNYASVDFVCISGTVWGVL